MSFELYIASPCASYGDPGANPSKVSKLSLLARMWMWLTQLWGREAFAQSAEAVFCLGPNDILKGHKFQHLVSAEGLNRYRRRLLARYLRLGLSLSQIKAWVKARHKSRRFQTALAGYFSLTFFRRAARHRSRLWRQDLGRSEACKAPLAPD